MAFLMVRISAISSALRERCRNSFLSRPIPCSAEIEPRRSGHHAVDDPFDVQFRHRVAGHAHRDVQVAIGHVAEIKDRQFRPPLVERRLDLRDQLADLAGRYTDIESQLGPETGLLPFTRGIANGPELADLALRLGNDGVLD